MQQRRVPGPCQSILKAYGESGAVFPSKNDKIAAAWLCSFSFLASRRQIFQYRYFYLFRHYHRFTSWRQGKLD